jgi:DNA-binding MarR family transcriptional regulator
MSHAEECALQVMETLPRVMRCARVEAHRRRSLDLTTPQFRSLRMLERYGAVSLNDLAQRLDLTAPTTSRVVQALTAQGLVTREVDQVDRRRIVLQLTNVGREKLEMLKGEMIAALTRRLENISSEDLTVVMRSLLILREAFAVGPCGANEC